MSRKKTIIVLLFIVAILFFLRMVPAINNKVEFNLDAAFNYRMTESVLIKGDVPRVDNLSTYPIGKEIKALLPTGMYHLSATFNKILNTFGRISLDRSILYFCAFCGSLIALPLFGISYTIYNDKITALITAFLGGIIPAYLTRTASYWYRQEIVGVPVIFVSLFFFIKAIKSRNMRQAFIYSVLSYAVLAASLYLWRLAVLFLAAYTIILIYFFLREDGFFKSRLPLVGATLAMYVAMFFVIPGFGLKNPGSSYIDFPKAAYEIIMMNLGFNIELGDFARLIYYDQELGGVSVPGMFGWRVLSAAGVFAVIYIIARIASRNRSAEKDAILIFLIFASILTFIFLRNKIILGPIAAITLGESVDMIARRRNIIIKNVLYTLLVIIIFFTALNALFVALTQYVNTRLRPFQKQALEAINRLVPPASPVLCYWADGYPVQTYCGRPTITDGLFESSQIVGRIIAESKAYLSSDENEFIKLCKSYGVKYILVPKDRKMAYAGCAGVSWPLLIDERGPTRLGMMTLLFRLIYRPEEQESFKLLYANNNFNLFLLRK